jgi:hypothetical protein
LSNITLAFNQGTGRYRAVFKSTTTPEFVGLNLPPRGSIRPVKPGTKRAQVVDLLRRPEGVSLEEIQEVGQWDQHTAKDCVRKINLSQGYEIVCRSIDGSLRLWAVNPVLNIAPEVLS